MKALTIACCLWDANDDSLPFSRHYTGIDVEKLYRGFKRNLTRPFRFVCFTEKPRTFSEPIWQERLTQAEPDYGAMIEPFRLNGPMFVCGLDTVVVGSCDALADYVMTAGQIAAPQDPFFPEKWCNAIVLGHEGCSYLWDQFPGGNDMEWIRAQPSVASIDRMFPRAVVSYKGFVKHFGVPDEAAIVYFHGEEKPHQLAHMDWVTEHWQ